MLLNDPEFVEAARGLAMKTLAEAGDGESARARFMLRRAIGRSPTDEEVAVLTDVVERHRPAFTTDLDAAQGLVAVRALPPPATYDPAELAAWTSAARVVLNLHEVYTRN